MPDTEPSAADTLTDAIRESYDALPYDNLPRWTTHPDCLATAAHLRGFEVPAVATARVLELGCSTGVNLIALAVALPAGRYVGVDLSATQIDTARAIAATLGLEQVRFETADLRAVVGALGEFDYIVCHGVYSHVPADVQEAILSICSRSLAPNGVACVSQNAYPGWYMRGMVRDLLRRHVRDTPGPALQAPKARQFIGLLAQHAQPQGGWFAGALAYENRILADARDTYIAHEHLDPVNEPLWLEDFVARARRHGLDYLGEALPEPLPGDLPGGLGEVLARLGGDPVAHDQYLDCFLGRAFRRTLLCRSGAPLHARTAVETVGPLVVRARAAPASEQPVVREIAEETFRTADGYAATTNDPLVKALLVALHRGAPRTPGFDELRSEVAEMLAGAWPAPYRADDPSPVAETLLRLHRGSLLRLQALAIPFAAVAGERPRASPLAREQASAGARVSTLRHDTVELEEAERVLLVLLDGTRDRMALLADCATYDAARLEESLARMARHALLTR